MKTINDLKGNDIELWAEQAEKILTSNIRELTKEEALDFAKVTLSEKNLETDNEFNEKLEKNKLGLVSLIWNRVKFCHSYQISKGLALYLGVTLDRPGTAVIITNYLQWKAFKAGIKKVDMEFFSRNVFPLGIPTEEAFHKVWDMQKVEREKGQTGSDNMLDYAKCQESITFK